MKTFKFLLLLMLAFVFSRTGFSYELHISSPSVCETSPTPIFFPDVECDASFMLSSHQNELHRFVCEITLQQDGHSQQVFSGLIETDKSYSIPVNVTVLQGFLYNKLTRVKFFFRSSSPPYLNYITKYGYLVVYNSTPEAEYNSVTDGVAEIDFQGPSMLINGDGCSCAGSSWYPLVRRYKITFDIYGDFTNKIPEVIPSLSIGYSAANPNFQSRWAYKTIQTTTHARFITYVYRLFNILGQEVGCCPIFPSKATVVFRNIVRPVMSNLIQVTNPVNPLSPTTVVYPVISQGNGTLIYNWRDTNRTSGISFASNGNTASVHFNFNLNSDANLFPNYKVKCQIGNSFGWSNWKEIPIFFSSTLPLCPQILFERDSISYFENTILPSSVTSYPKLVSDYYILRDPGLPLMEDIKFSLKELEDDVTTLDYISLKKISVKDGESFAVTDKGDVISYLNNDESHKVICTIDGMDVTEKLLTSDNEMERIEKSQSLKIQCEPLNQGYLVLTAQNPVEKDSIAATITSSAGLRDSFYVRPYRNKICISLIDREVREIEIHAKTSFDLDEVSIVSNTGNAIVRTLGCKLSKLDDVDVAYKLSQKDDLNIQFGINDKLEFIYENIKGVNDVSGYLVESFGGYRKSNMILPKSSTEKIASDMLIENFPNPFNPVTKISFVLSSGTHTKLTIYDILGREVTVLTDEFKEAGKYEMFFDGSNFAAGVYFYELVTDHVRDIRRMILIK